MSGTGQGKKKGMNLILFWTFIVQCTSIYVGLVAKAFLLCTSLINFKNEARDSELSCTLQTWLGLATGSTRQNTNSRLHHKPSGKMQKQRDRCSYALNY